MNVINTFLACCIFSFFMDIWIYVLTKTSNKHIFVYLHFFLFDGYMFYQMLVIYPWTFVVVKFCQMTCFFYTGINEPLWLNILSNVLLLNSHGCNNNIFKVRHFGFLFLLQCFSNWKYIHWILSWISNQTILRNWFGGF